jgi:hypothetical protein
VGCSANKRRRIREPFCPHQTPASAKHPTSPYQINFQEIQILLFIGEGQSAGLIGFEYSAAESSSGRGAWKRSSQEAINCWVYISYLLGLEQGIEKNICA